MGWRSGLQAHQVRPSLYCSQWQQPQSRAGWESPGFSLGRGHLSQPRETGLHLLPFFPAETPRDTGMVPLSQCEVVSAVGLSLHAVRKLSRRPSAVPGDPTLHSGPCTPHSSFPTQKVDKISLIERPETCPFTSLRLLFLPAPSDPNIIVLYAGLISEDGN